MRPDVEFSLVLDSYDIHPFHCAVDFSPHFSDDDLPGDFNSAVSELLQEPKKL
ncbi:hypothetical protein DPMN_117919 [Dreissena polymorpha]|uniref:Uncharacterized protein n=1 Tax=Dreissena polymorpha TaxID=45954 RepID=A0A9D4GJ83_DREPO|nr:hypothetical protein DPMN_117919 [Dreissena polymorpha]